MVKVIQAVEKIDLNSEDIQFTLGEAEVTLSAEITPSGANQKVNWTTQNSFTVELRENENGSVTIIGKSAGDTKVRATSVGDPTKFKECKVLVKPTFDSFVPNLPVEGLKFDEGVGNTKDVSLIISPVGAKAPEFFWEPDRSGIIEIIDTGDNHRKTIKAVGTGETTVTVTSIIPSKGKQTFKVFVNEPVTDVSRLSPEGEEVHLFPDHPTKGRIQLNSSILPLGATDKKLVWTTTDKSVTTIKEDETNSSFVTIIAHAPKVDAVRRTRARPPVIIRATSSSNPDKYTEWKINISTPVTEVKPIISDIQLKMSETLDASVVVLPLDATEKGLLWTSNPPGIIEITGSENEKKTLKPINVGETIITVASLEDMKISTTIKVTVIQPVTGIKALSHFEAISSPTTESLRLMPGDTTTLSAAVEPFDATNKKIHWISGNESVAKVEAGVVTVQPGASGVRVSISAQSDENPSFAVIWLIDIEIPINSVVLNPQATIRAKKGDRIPLNASIKPVNATINTLTWTSANRSIVTVDTPSTTEIEATNTIEIVGDFEKTEITVTDDLGNLLGTFKIEPIPTVTNITINTQEKPLDLNTSRDLDFVLAPSYATKENSVVNWESSDQTVVSVTQKGVIRALKPSTVPIIITATPAVRDNPDLKAEYSVTVDVPLTNILLNYDTYEMYVDSDPIKFTEILVPENATNKTVRWYSSDQSIVNIDMNSGYITALKPTATNEDVKIWAQVDEIKSKRCSVTVKRAVTSVQFTQTIDTMNVGDEIEFAAMVLPEGAPSSIDWTTTDNTAVTLTRMEGGKVKVRANRATAEGTPVQLTAASSDNPEKLIVQSITIEQPVKKIVFTARERDMAVGSESAWLPVVLPDNATSKNLFWTTNNARAVDVDQHTGQVKALKVGTATITAYAMDGSDQKDWYTIDVKPAPTDLFFNINSMILDTRIEAESFGVLTPTVLPLGAYIDFENDITWDVKDPDGVVSLVFDKDGRVEITAIKPGKATIQAKLTRSSPSIQMPTCTVTVAQPITEFYLDDNFVSLKINEEKTLTSKIVPDWADAQIINWHSSDNSTVTMSGPARVKALKYGTVEITASITERDGTIKKAICSVTVPRPSTGVFISENNLSMTIGDSKQLTASILPNGKVNENIVWDSSDKTVVSVNNGYVRVLKATSKLVTITARESHVPLSDAKSNDCVITVKEYKPVTGISFVNSANKEFLYLGKTTQVLWTVWPTDATNKTVDIKSTHPTIASITKDGVILAKTVGRTSIVLTTADGGKTIQKEIEVIKAVTGVTLNKEKVTIPNNSSYKLEETVRPLDASIKTVKWSSSNPSTVYIDEDSGLITAANTGSGEAVITATTVDGSKKAFCTVKVAEPVTKLELKPASLILDQGKTAYIDSIFNGGGDKQPSNTNIDWSSTEETTVSVNKYGMIKAESPGVAVIVAKSKDGNITATSTVTVPVPVTDIKINGGADSLTLKLHSKERLTLEFAPVNATERKAQWYSSNTSLVTVAIPNSSVPGDDIGYTCEVTALGHGTATITAVSQDGDKIYSDTISITVSKDVTGLSLNTDAPDSLPEGVVANYGKLTVLKGNTATLVATIEPADATNKEVKWHSSATSFVQVDDYGVVTAKNFGTAVITASSKDNPAVYSTCHVTVPVPVSSVTITPPLSTTILLSNGGTAVLRLNADVQPSNATNSGVRWESSNEDVGKMTGAVFTATTEGSSTITVISDYDSTKRDSIVVTVVKPITKIELKVPDSSRSNPILSVGGVITLQHYIEPQDASIKKLDWAHTTDAVSVSSSGVVTGQKPGTSIVTATATDGSNVSGSITITVVLPVESITIADNAPTRMNVKTRQTLSVVLHPADTTYGSVEWEMTSDGGTGSTITTDGQFTAGGIKGSVTVTAKAGAQGAQKTVSHTIEIVQPIETLSITDDSDNVIVAPLSFPVNGGSKILGAKISPDNYTPEQLDWKSTITSVATVTNGVILPLKAGTTVVSVSSSTNPAVKAQITVIILETVKNIEITYDKEKYGDAPFVEEGKMLTLKGLIKPVNAANKKIKWETSDENYASVTDGVVTGVKKGIVRITAKSDDNELIYDTLIFDVVEPIVSVTHVTLSSYEISLKVGEIESLVAKAESSTGKDVTNKEVWFASAAGDIAEVDQRVGVITAIGPGTTYITAVSKDPSVPENSVFSVCKVVVVGPATGVEIDSSIKEVGVNQTVVLSARVIPIEAEDKRITWKSLTPSVIAVDTDTGSVTGLIVGQGRVEVATFDGSYKAEAVIDVKAQVVDSLILTPSDSFSLRVGSKPYQLEVHGLSSNGDVVEVSRGYSWVSSDEKVASVDNATGLVNAHRAGTATITVYAVGSAAPPQSCTVNVPWDIAEVELNHTTLAMEIGDVRQLSARVLPQPPEGEAVDLTWDQNDKTVASVGFDGYVTAVGVGTTDIVVTAVDAHGGKKTEICTVTVTKKVEKLEIHPAALNLRPNEAIKLNVTVFPAEEDVSQEVIWSTASNLVTITSERVGKGIVGDPVLIGSEVTVTARSDVGDVIITAQTLNGKKAAHAVISIGHPVTGVALLKDNNVTELTVGSTAQLVPTIYPEDATNRGVSWNSSRPDVIDVSSTGFVTALKPGTSVITVTTWNGQFVDYLSISVYDEPTSIRLDSEDTLHFYVGEEGRAIQAFVWPETANPKIKWVSGDQSIVSVDNNGFVKPLQSTDEKGSIQITAYSVADETIAPATVTVHVRETIKQIIFSDASLHLKYQDTHQITAKTLPEPELGDNINRRLVWDTGDDTVARVTQTGFVTAVGAGQTNIFAYSEDNPSVKQECTIEVTVSPIDLLLDKYMLPLEPGEEGTLYTTPVPVIATVTDADLHWSIFDESIAKFVSSANGFLTIEALTAGSTTVQVALRSDLSVTKTCEVIVTPLVERVLLTQIKNELNVGERIQLVAKVLPATAKNKRIHWESSDSSIVDLKMSSTSGDAEFTGEIEALKKGSATITIWAESGGWEADGTPKIKETFTLTVKQPVEDIVVAPVYVAIDKEVPLNYFVKPDNADDKAIRFQPSDSSIFTINESTAMIKGVGLGPEGDGSGFIIATSNDGSVVSQSRVTVFQPATGIHINSDKFTVAVGKGIQIPATVLPVDAVDKTILWHSSDETYASVIDGFLRGIRPTKTNESIKITGTIPNTTITKSFDLTVVELVEEIRVDSNNWKIPVGETREVKAFVLPRNATDKKITWESLDGSVATIEEKSSTSSRADADNTIYQIIANGVGETTLVAIAEDESKVTASIRVRVTPRVSDVRLTDISLLLDIGDTEKLTATVFPEAVQERGVTWKSLNIDDDNESSAVFVGNDGIVHAVKGGLARVVATSIDGTVDADGKPLDPPISRSEECIVEVREPVKSVTIEPKNANDNNVLKIGEILLLKAVIEPANATTQSITWDDGRSSFASVSATGAVTAHSVGVVEIVAIASDGHKTDSYTVTVIDGVSGIGFDELTLRVPVGEARGLELTVEPPSVLETGKLIWTPEDKTIANVINGVVHGLKKGVTEVTAELEAKNGEKYTAMCVVNVVEPVTKVTVKEKQLSLDIGEITNPLEVAVKGENDAIPTNDTVTWSSTRPTVATVNPNTGVVTAVGGGSTTITATSNDNTSIYDVCDVKVVVPAKQITLSTYFMELSVGQDDLVIATVDPSNVTDRTVEWKIDEGDEVITVNDGLIRGIKKGTAKIRVYPAGIDPTKIFKIIDVTVTVPVTGVTIRPPTLTLVVGKSTTLKETVLPDGDSGASDKKVSWHSLAEDIALVDSSGRVTGLKRGPATIIVTTQDGNFTHTCEVTVVDRPTSLVLNKTSLTLNINDGLQLTATPFPVGSVYASDDLPLRWEVINSKDATGTDVDNSEIIKVNPETGFVTALGKNGRATIKVSTVGDKIIEDFCSVEVRTPVKGIQVVNSVINLKVKETDQIEFKMLPAEASDNTIKWKSGNEEAVWVNENTGSITALAEGEAEITATAADGGAIDKCFVYVSED
ncbi:MAG: Ig-like domain-containing protein [Treponemataceae bacterium]